MLYITENAAAMVRLSAEAGGSRGCPLRITAHAQVVAPGKTTFQMGFDDPRPGDHQWECNGVAVLVTEESREPLEHVILDFQEVPGSGPQFVFIAHGAGAVDAPSRGGRGQ